MVKQWISDEEVINATNRVYSRWFSTPFRLLDIVTSDELKIFLYFPLEKVPKGVQEDFIFTKKVALSEIDDRLPKAKEYYITDPLGYEKDLKRELGPSINVYLLWWFLSKGEWQQLEKRREDHRVKLERQRVEEEHRKQAEQEAARQAELDENAARITAQQKALYGSVSGDGSASGALMIYGFSGSGKSYFLGNGLCFENLKRGIGTIVIDPIGGTINAFLTRVARDAPELEERIIYCNMAGERVEDDIYVPSFPLLYRRTDDEELYDIAQKFINTIARTERSFTDASIQGISRLRPLLTRISMVLAAHGLPLTYALDMLDEPEEWIPYFKQLENHPEAVEFPRLCGHVYLTLR